MLVVISQSPCIYLVGSNKAAILASSRVSISSYRVESVLPSLYCLILGEFKIKLADKITLEPQTKKNGDGHVALLC